MASRCAHCGQLLTTERVGVQLTVLKAAIFDQIRAAGPFGISTTEIICSELYRDRQPYRGRRALGENGIKSHVWQINEKLEETPWIIVSDRRRWFLRGRNGRRAA